MPCAADFRLLWSGQTISLVGDGAFLVALGWKSFELTGSKSTLALVLLGHSAAMLATLLIGGHSPTAPPAAR